jgi:hypothetical protein
LVSGFIAHLQMVTTSNYDALANSCSHLLTTPHNKSSQFGFTSRFLVTDPNNVLYLRPYWLVNVSQPTKLQTCPAYNPSARTAYKTPLSIVVVQSLSWENVCLRSRYSATTAVYLLISRSLFIEALLSNGPACTI